MKRTLSPIWTGRARSLSNRATEPLDVPVVVVGGGPCGLMMSNLLSSYRVPSLLLEAQSQENHFQHPQAHFLNTRTMEILRHALPRVYHRVLEAMPDRESWRYFQFGQSCSSGIMARVVHPVDRALDSERDANGTLMPFGEIHANTSPIAERPLSACLAGHLAQHTFSRILWEEGINSAAPDTNLQFNTKVVSVQQDHEERHLVTTASGETFRSPILVAADGSNSRIRKAWDIDWKGQANMQHLINIHFTTSKETSSRLPPAMLYSVFNPKVVGMMVCHSPGEYVLQVPYFPPYQTVEEDFSTDKVLEIVSAAIGFPDLSINVKSVRSWTMAAMIAADYNPRAGAFLVGDAAHVFPPAGGFGMNTGLQDAHALAWRIAFAHHSNHDRSTIVSSYGQERRRVAQANAALSVRNYHRVLNVTKACYLDSNHPDLLIRMLDSSTFLPLPARRTMFKALLNTALMPLSALSDPRSSIHGRMILSNIRTLLEKGEGLPLLFPKLEIGFVYGEKIEENPDWKDDTQPHKPRIEVGGLMPHVELEVLVSDEGTYCNLQPQEKDQTQLTISLTDLPAQIRKDLPCFVLLGVNGATAVDDVNTSIQDLEIQFVEVLNRGETGTAPLQLRDKDGILQSIISEPAWLLIRPDGHVAKILPDRCRLSEHIRLLF